MTLVWGFVLMGFGFVKWGPLLEAGLTVASLPFGSLLGLFLLGTFDRGANALGALVGMFAGLAAVLSILQFTNVAYTWYFLIGAGVFLVPSAMTRATGSVGLVFLVWVVGGALSLFGALTIAELGAAMPEAGGAYVYLRRGLGPVWGFLFGWMNNLVGKPSSI